MAVVEAGLGGRYDATNVIDSPVAVLTNVGLEHTRWLGPTCATSPRRSSRSSPRRALVLGAEMAREALALAGGSPCERERDRAPSAAADRLDAACQRARSSGATSRSRAPPRRPICARAGIELDQRARARGGRARPSVPGRLQVLDERPADAARRRSQPGRRRRARASRCRSSARPRRGARAGRARGQGRRGMLAPLLPLCERAWFTAPPSPRALPPATLASLARQLGFEAAVCEPQPRAALAQARELGAASAAARCSRPARCTWSATCCARAASGLAITAGGCAGRGRQERRADERRRPLGADDGRRGRADRGACDPVFFAPATASAACFSKLSRPMPPLAYFGIESSGLSLASTC